MFFRRFSTPLVTGLLALFLMIAASVYLSIAPQVNSAPSQPTPEVVLLEPANSVFRLSIVSNDIIYNPADHLLYVSRPSTAGADGNSLSRIDPLNGAIVGSVYVGSEPNLLAVSDNGQTLYVSLDGAYGIRRYDATTQTPGIQFSIGRGQSVNAQDAPYRASDMAVVPGNPDQLAVARYLPGISPPGVGVALYNNGVRLPNTGPGHSDGANYLAFSATPGLLYGGGYDTGLRQMTVDANGITDTTPGTSPSWVHRVKFQGGKLFDSEGRILDPVARTLLGTCAGNVGAAFVPDVATGRVLYAQKDATGSGVTIKACDINTFATIGTPLAIPNVGFDLNVTDLERYGTNGLAMRTTNNQIYFIQTDLLPTANPLPTPSVTPANTPTPTPTSYAMFMRTVTLPNRDLIRRDSDQKFFASVPNATPDPRANTVTRIDPTTATIESSVAVGTDPGRLAFSDDEQTMYIGINSANAVRKFNMATMTPETQFPLGVGVNGPKIAYDIKVLPGTSDSVAVSYGSSSYNYDGVDIYDNGVKRAQKAAPSGRIQIASPTTLFIGDYYMSKWEISPIGLSPQGSFSTSSSGSESILINNLMYTSSGGVVDISSPTYNFVGSFTGMGYRPGIAVDVPNNRVFFLADINPTGFPLYAIMAYRLDNFRPVGTVPLPGVTMSIPYPESPARLYRWGTNGLAFHNNIDKIYFVQSDIISPNGTIPSALQLGATTFSGSEATASMPITVVRTGGITGTSTVQYATSDGTAIAGQDYTAMSGTLTFAPGESSKTINVPIANDTVYEGNETFSIAISNPGGDGSVEIFQPSTATITIQDNDQVPNVSGASLTVAEPRIIGIASANITVQLSNPTTQTATVNYATANGSALAGSDYIATSGMLTFAPLETTKTITIQILADQNYTESNEFFFVNFSNPVNTWVGSSPSITITNYNPAIARHTSFDFDDDGKSDIGIFRPSVGEWWINRSSTGTTYAAQFGNGEDYMVPGDHTGDGKTDIAAWRPLNGNWYILRSEDFSFYSFPFGTEGDIPVPADYDADGKFDAAVFRPSTNTWFIKQSSNESAVIFQFGSAGDVPVVADYDGDHKADAAIYRPSVGQWWIKRSSSSVIALTFGAATDKPVQGDYTGDGKADIALWRPSTGEWYVLRSEDFSYYSLPFGTSGDVPAPGDYDGDGKFDTTVFRPLNATWYSQRTTAGTLIQQFGATGDRPIPNAYVP